MANPWIETIKKNKELTVFAGPGLKVAPAWGEALFRDTLDEFNRLSVVSRLGVILKPSQTAPAPDGAGGANVQVEVTGGTHKFTTLGREFTKSLSAGASGVTHPVAPTGELVRCFIFVLLNPTIEGVDSRGVDNGVKKAIILHELIHACGLDEEDHSPESSPDLFMTNRSVIARALPEPRQDRLLLRNEPRTTVPPFFISANTARKIQSVWK